MCLTEADNKGKNGAYLEISSADWSYDWYCGVALSASGAESGTAGNTATTAGVIYGRIVTVNEC